METVHDIVFGFGKGNQVLAQLKETGIKLRVASGFQGDHLVALEISESHPSWGLVKSLVETYQASDLTEIRFSDDEILEAEWVELGCTFYQGYPQPEKSWLRESPNYQNYCLECGTHQQIGSFFLKKEPNLRANDFMSLFWTSAIFGKLAVFDSLVTHQIRGYQKVDALLQKTNLPSTVVAQLMPTIVAKPGLVVPDILTGVTCPTCGITKYLPLKKGVMRLRQKLLPEGADIFATHEWFGDGGMAFHEILISQRVAKLAISQKWKGIRLKVVESI
jgi:hypothetical protein